MYGQCFVRAVGDAGGGLKFGAEIAFEGSTLVNRQCSEGADHDAGPAADALFTVVDDSPFFLVEVHGAGEAGGDAWGVGAVVALDS